MFLGNVSNFEEYVEYQKELFAEMGFDSFSYEAREEVIDQFVNKKSRANPRFSQEKLTFLVYFL